MGLKDVWWVALCAAGSGSVWYQWPCHFRTSICLSDQIRAPLHLCLQPVSPVDSIGKFIGERLVTSQCHPGPRLMPGMQLYPVSLLVFIKRYQAPCTKKVIIHWFGHQWPCLVHSGFASLELLGVGPFVPLCSAWQLGMKGWSGLGVRLSPCLRFSCLDLKVLSSLWGIFKLTLMKGSQKATGKSWVFSS